MIVLISGHHREILCRCKLRKRLHILKRMNANVKPVHKNPPQKLYKIQFVVYNGVNSRTD